jgi:hypothetical protein
VLFFTLPFNVFSQTPPLTVQPSTGNVGVNQTNPQAKLDVDGTVHVTGTVNVGNTVTATGFVGDGSQLTNLPGASGADVQVFTTPGANTWSKPANAKLVYVWAIGGGQGGGLGTTWG